MNRKQIWKKLLLVLGGLLLAWLVVILFFDPPPPDDSDLALPERKIDPTQNPFPEILDSLPSYEEQVELEEVASKLDRGEKVEAVQIEKLLLQHETLLKRFEQYAAMRSWRHDGSQIDYYSQEGFKHLAKLMHLKSSKLASEGLWKSAAENAALILEFSAGLQMSELTVWQCAHLAQISQTGATALNELLDQHQFTDKELADLSARLNDPFLTSNSFEVALRTSYAVFLSTAIDRATFDREVTKSGNWNFSTPRWIPTRMTLKPNLSRNRISNFFRISIDESSSDYERFSEITERVSQLNFREKSAYLLLGNSIGLEMFDSLDRLKHRFHLFFQNRADLALLQTRVAMERYRLAHGDWAPDLQAFAPTYLAEVPIDPMDGKPIRYNTARRVIYSVGTDLVDEGGIATDETFPFGIRFEISIELEPADQTLFRPKPDPLESTARP